MMVTKIENQIEELSIVFAALTNHREHQIEIDNKLADHGIPRGTLNEMIVSPEKLDQLSEEEVALITKYTFEVTQDFRIKPENFYSEKELKRIMKYKKEQEGDLTLPYTFENVLRAGADDYLTVLSYKEIYRLWNNKILTYNTQTQRLSKKRINAKGKIVEKADVNQRSVKSITKLMLDGKYKPSTLLFNILVDGNDSVDYSSAELTIGEGTTLNLIDGMHRVMAICNVIEENPEFEGYMNIDLKHYPLEDAQFLLGQTNTVNRFDKTLIKHYMGATLGDLIAKDLMNIPELKGRVSIKTTLDKKMSYLTNYSILSESVQSIFEPQNNKERYDYLEVLKKFYGYLISYYDTAFGSKTMKEVAKESWLNHHNSFVGFTVIAKKLYDKYGKDFPVSEIVKVVDSIDLQRKEGAEYNDLMTTQGKVNSNRVKKQIREFFEKKADEVLK